MLELHGKGYVIEHCVAAFRRAQDEKLYRSYVTEALKAITENTAHYVGMKGIVKAGVTFNKSYQELIKPDSQTHKAKKEETRSGEEIISDIRNKLKKMGGGKG